MPKKHVIEFETASEPITIATTKFGGQPVWIAGRQWPLSRKTGNPMRFICQIAIAPEIFPNTTARMAYLFMTDEDHNEYVDATWEPDGGENAVILQPGKINVPTKEIDVGPSLYQMVPQPGFQLLQPQLCEFAVRLTEQDDVDFLPETERFDLPKDQQQSAMGKLNESKIGGTPVFLQGDEFPFVGICQLLLQLDACSVPFSINFGDSGVGYAFLNEAGEEAKFLWQCC